MNISICSSMSELPAAEWDSLVGTEQPFLRYDFLNALEQTGCVSQQTGWVPHHFAVRDEPSGRLLAAAPAYVKQHSYGEYVFDWQWASAYKATGEPYYPKLLMAVPFTPVTGARVLTAPEVEAQSVVPLIMAAAEQSVARLSLSSIHCLFPTEAQAEMMERHDWAMREAFQFHWRNDEYASFDDYLAGMTSKRRKAIRRERRQVAESGIVFEQLSGAEIGDDHWHWFYRFYRDTLTRYGAIPYLSQAFFEQIGQVMSGQVLLIFALRDGQPIAGSFNLMDDETLYGRYWGCVTDVNGLHFETCYYQAIEYCIQNGLRRFEAGAQGEHKLDRGFLPTTTRSAHWFRHSPFFDAIKSVLVEETPAVQRRADLYTEHSPFKSETVGQ